MASYNKVTMIGNLTRDPEVRFTPKGSAVCDVSLAINRTFTTEGGEKQEEVTFVDVVFWAKLAELAGKYLKKGRPVFIEGRLQMDSWEDKQTGQKRTRLRVVGEQMQFLNGAPEGQERTQERAEEPPARGKPSGGGYSSRNRMPQGQRTAAEAPPAQESYRDGLEEDDSSIPF